MAIAVPIAFGNHSFARGPVAIRAAKYFPITGSSMEGTQAFSVLDYALKFKLR